MQYINFIRDIAEDLKLGRIYMPGDQLKNHGISNLDYEYVKSIPDKFTNFIHKQLEYYCNWQHIAEEGYKFIPKRYLIPVKTASEMYNWTAEQIYNNPFIVYHKKVKPQISQIISTTLINIVDPRIQKRRKLLTLYKKPVPDYNCY